MYSMTGFGSASEGDNGREISIEIKSVNHRFLDLVLKLPKNLSFLESDFRNLISSTLNRGHVELFIKYENTREDNKTVDVDVPLLKQYLQAFDTVKEHCNRLAPDISHSDIMHMQDVLSVSEEDDDKEAIRALAVHVLGHALEELAGMRAKEGEQLKNDTAMRIQTLKDLMSQVEKIAPQVPVVYGEKIKTRISEYLMDVEVDQDRLLNEIAVFSDRCNIDEEITRFNSHILQFESMLDSDEPIGRKMEFTLQELNREVNTIGSKANDAGITKYVLELKAELEKIREQTQNIE